ncbi:hypothetical protein CHS0354_032300 [Potamilus streckersoni]|uniref:Uncharacterized protein n=1 Tax=Potamilus streckersoni TaxID=2493646 RepID=A0AAE0RQ09_9BIVA|nr:hypothetical protein CHS0354_032300 [Potamilus streckersoni]
MNNILVRRKDYNSDFITPPNRATTAERVTTNSDCPGGRLARQFVFPQRLEGPRGVTQRRQNKNKLNVFMEPIDHCLDFPGEFHFVGRQDVLAELDNAWKENHLIYGIYGLRSVGKSRTVREFLKRKYCEIESSALQYLNVMKLLIVQTDLKFIDHKETLYTQLCASLGILPQGVNLSNTKKHFDTCVEYIGNNTDLLYVFIFENAEKTYEISFDTKEKCTMKDELQKLCVDLVTSCTNVRIFLTSTTELLFAQTKKVFYKCELKPMSQEDSTQLLTSVASEMRSHDCTEKIVNLCCGLPLALIIVGSSLTQEGFQEPMDFVESLTECRIKALSNESFTKEDRIEDLYSEFLLKLTVVFQQRLAVLGFIPGTFSAKQATELLDEGHSIAVTKSEVLVPLKRRSMLTYHPDTKRLDIHGILRDCLEVYIIIKDLPGVCIKYCKIFTEEMEKIAKQIDSREYAEALAVFSLEYPNLRKLLRLLSIHENTKEDTYPFMIQISSTCSSLIEKFLAADSEKFYDCSLKLASQYGKVRDEAIIKIAYGSMQTMSKGDFLAGETYYHEALRVLREDKSKDVASLYLKLGNNLYYQWRGEEAYRYLLESLGIFEGLGLIDSEMSVQVFNLLGLVLTLNG